MKLFCKDLAHLPSRETIKKLPKDGEHVVLKFPKNIAKEKKTMATHVKLDKRVTAVSGLAILWL